MYLLSSSTVSVYSQQVNRITGYQGKSKKSKSKGHNKRRRFYESDCSIVALSYCQNDELLDASCLWQDLLEEQTIIVQVSALRESIPFLSKSVIW